MRRNLIIAVVIGTMAVLAGAMSQTAAVDAADRAAIERVIRNQIAAFRRDDRVAAFALASPGIQAAFGTSEPFMGVVRQGYQPVCQPSQVRFREVIMRDWEPEKRVFVVGCDGQRYIAVYPMERQADGSWKTNGCSLERSQSA